MHAIVNLRLKLLTFWWILDLLFNGTCRRINLWCLGHDALHVLFKLRHRLRAREDEWSRCITWGDGGTTPVDTITAYIIHIYTSWTYKLNLWAKHGMGSPDWPPSLVTKSLWAWCILWKLHQTGAKSLLLSIIPCMSLFLSWVGWGKGKIGQSYWVHMCACMQYIDLDMRTSYMWSLVCMYMYRACQL